MSTGRLQFVTAAASPLRGRIRVPGDKSISHRAIMFASLADGVSRITGFLEGEDTLATAAVFRALGVQIDAPSAGERVVHGVGIDGLRGTDATLDCGNAGTAMRLLAGLLAAQPFDSTLTGDVSLSKRPMRRVIEPLASMGARIDAEGGLPPLHLRSGQRLLAIDYTLPVASAQVKSALLLAGLYAEGETIVREPHPTRDYTESMLRQFGVVIDYAPGHATLRGGQRLRACDIDVPADFSSAAFFLVAASIIPGSDLVLEAVGMNPRRTGLLATLRDMGADIRVEREAMQGGESVADLRVRHARLHGIEVPVTRVPDMIDEFPALFVAATAAEGDTIVRGAAELRVKESDRLATMSAALRALGARIDETDDGATVYGGTALTGGRVHAHGDHRIAMSSAIAGQLASAAVIIDDCDNVATSFPGFVELTTSIGFGLTARHIG
ncbi:MAG: 3-phosphoshikimate 1-carboxyvinyltransferase [Xanthomonadales bacterium]|nr:3-phosphoshikimate 1-carboxyvinyltransferase [Xanthomonadales bacterium]